MYTEENLIPLANVFEILKKCFAVQVECGDYQFLTKVELDSEIPESGLFLHFEVDDRNPNESPTNFDFNVIDNEQVDVDADGGIFYLLDTDGYVVKVTVLNPCFN